MSEVLTCKTEGSAFFKNVTAVNTPIFIIIIIIITKAYMALCDVSSVTC